MGTRAFDVAFSLVVLFFSLPVFAIAALITLLDSGRPVIFKQVRVGRYQKPFTMFKLRSMRSEGGTLITARNDTRITRAGRLLRRTNFDELPQFFNVFRGDLSVVGPRPEMPAIVARYQPHWRRIFEFKPGFTSLATVTFIDEERLLPADDVEEYYFRSILPQKIQCDLEYFSSQRTLFRDILIILRTVGRTFSKKKHE